MRVAADQLLGHLLGDVAQRARSALLEQQREELDLEEDVPELIGELGVIAAVGRIGQLVGLLDGVGHDRALILLAVPGTFDTELAGDRVEPLQRCGGIGLRALAG